jgi:hypothetical protein
VLSSGKEIVLAEHTNVRRRVRRSIAAVVGAMLTVAMAGASAASSSPRSPIPRLPAGPGSLTAFDINDRGQIVGAYENPDAEPGFGRNGM